MSVARASGAILSAAWRSDPGRVRDNNEDLAVCDPARGIYAVVDGVGGHASGEMAAAIAREAILERLARPLGSPSEKVREAIALANKEIFKEAERSPEHGGMTCVLTLALVGDDRITIGHVGDTRMYLISPSGMRKVTRDHSPVGEREDAQEITEVEAMRHPRRNEVFRDVGSESRDKDEAGFIDLLEQPLEPDCAILLCSDGLTDMVPSAIIEHLVREHAGDPDAVVDALIDAANEAGGKDNVTVVYAEPSGFARAVRNGTTASAIPSRDRHDGDRHAGLGSRVSPFVRWTLASRSTWLTLGAVIGAIAALVLPSRLSGVADRGRTLVVGGTAPGAYTRIGDAMAAARPGDLVQLEPGTYIEQVVVGDGVGLAARVAGTATLARDPATSSPWTALSAGGLSGGRIYGVRIESTTTARVDVGLRVSGQGRTIENVDLDGPMRVGMQLTAASGVALRGCFVHTAQGTALAIDEKSDAAVTNNAFIRAGEAGAALLVQDPSRTVVSRNVFAGYGLDVMRGLTSDQRAELLSRNFVVAAEPAGVR